MQPLITESEVAQYLKIAKDHGGPVYIYSEKRIQQSYRRLKAGLPEDFEILYSVKANPHSDVLKKMKSLGTGADVASLAELENAMGIGFSPNQISFVGPGKSLPELSKALFENIHIVVESLTELKRIDELAGKFGKKISVSVRVHPKEITSASGREMESGPSQFGVDEDELPEFFKAYSQFKNVTIEGIHVYTQSQILSSDSLVKNFKKTGELALSLSQTYGFPLKRINFGGGFGIPYFSGESELDLASLRSFLSDWKQEKKSSLSGARFFVESGRFLLGECGFYVTQVLDKKKSRGKTFLVTDGGINHHQGATGIGQAIKKNFPLFNLSKWGWPAREVLNVAGPTCYSLDLLARDFTLPETEIGDFLVIGFSGAYGPTFSPSHFISRAPAAEILLKDGE